MKTETKTEQMKQKVQDTAKIVKSEAQLAKDKATAKAHEMGNDMKEKATHVKNVAKEKGTEAAHRAQEKAQQIKHRMDEM